MSIRLRPAELADAEAIRTIYNHEVKTSIMTFDLVPRTLAEQEDWIRARSGAYVAIVAENEEGEILAFGGLSQYRERPGYSTTCEDSVYVRGDAQGLGLGKMILTELVTKATQHGFHAIMAKIVGSHQASISLHSKLGFEIVGHEREVGRKFGQWLDVILMERLL